MTPPPTPPTPQENLPLDELEFARRCRALRWLLCDVDGVLTDGRLYYRADETEPFVAFDIKDGMALKLAQRGGLKVGLLSGRASQAVDRRARNLGLDLVIVGREDKGAALREWLERDGVDPRTIAYIGDDLLDLPVFAACGLALAPADGVDEVRAAAHRVLKNPGGRGAVREAVRSILLARGSWDGIVTAFAGS